MSMTTTNLRLSEELKGRIEALARETGRSEDDVMAEALTRYVEHDAWQMEQIEEGLRQADAHMLVPPEEMESLFDRLTTP